MTEWWVPSSSPTVSTTHTLRLFRVRDTRTISAISKTCLPNSLVSAVSARAIEANEPISSRGLYIENFRS